MVTKQNKIETKKVDFLKIKKGTVRFNCGNLIHNGIKELLFPNEEYKKEFKCSYERDLYDVIKYIGLDICDIEISTWYPLNGKDEYSLVNINYNKIISFGIDITFKYFTKFIERKIIEHSTSKNQKLEKYIEVIKISTSTLLHSNSIFCKILFNKYWNIVFDDMTLNYTSSDINEHIREQWRSSIEIEELRLKIKEKVDELCSSTIFSKSESQKIIINKSLDNLLKRLIGLLDDSEFESKFKQYNELKESILDLEQIKSLI